jgi:hypothetical protein
MNLVQVRQQDIRLNSPGCTVTRLFVRLGTDINDFVTVEKRALETRRHGGDQRCKHLRAGPW